MLGLGRLSELEHYGNMKLMVHRLPIHLQRKWIAEDTDSQQKKGTPATFEDLVNFIERQSRVLNNPRYKAERPDDPKRSQPNQSKDRMPKRTTFATNVKTQEGATGNSSSGATTTTCGFCNREGHSTWMCRKLGAKTHQEKMSWLKTDRYCFSCIRKGHRSDHCVNKATCRECQGKHPTLLHRNKSETSKEQGGEKPTDANDKSSKPADSNYREQSQTNERDKKETTSVCGRIGAGRKIGMSVVPVRIKSQETGKETTTLAFLDSGSGASFCTDAICEELGLQGNPTRLSLSTMTSKGESVQLKLIRNLEIAGIDTQHLISIRSLFVYPEIPVGKNEIVTRHDIENWEHLKDIPVPDPDLGVGLLLGNDVSQAILPLTVVAGEGDAPYAVKTQLGWSVSGPLGGTQQGHLAVNVLGASLQEQLQQYINMDFAEKVDTEDSAMSQEEQKFMDYVKEHMEHNGERYEVGLPLKADVTEILPNNREQALQRLQSVKRKMEKNQQFARDYEAFMEEMLRKNYVEAVEEHSGEEGKTWYLPHHGVYSKHKPGKIRIVFDGSVIFQGQSLNKRLLKGPDLTNRLDGVLMRFRQGKIGITSDVRKMFYQIGVTDQDRDLYRFLWYKDGEIKDYRLTVHVFGSTCSPGISNYALLRNAEDNADDFSPEIIEAAKNSSYVDDNIDSQDTVDMATEVAVGLTELRARAGFQLVGWVCSRPEVLKSLPQSAEVKESVDLSQGSAGGDTGTALGMVWNHNEDTISYRKPDLNKPNTRRGALAVVCSIFDPLGLISPLVLKGKLIIQEMVKRKLEWDAPLPGDLLQRWKEWKRSLEDVGSWTGNRCTNRELGKVTNRQVHVFSDASATGYGVAAFLREEDEEGQVCVNLIYARSRVTPIKPHSIPRLELAAAVTAARVMRHVSTELKGQIDVKKLWTDSQIVLGYLNNETKNFKVFVANRIATIRRLTEPEQWNFVPGQCNPADIASRGTNLQGLQSELWLHGPAFLVEGQESWPTVDLKQVEKAIEDDLEVKVARTDVVRNTTVEILERMSEWRSIIAFVVTMMKGAKPKHGGPASRTRAKFTAERKSRVQQENESKLAVFRVLQKAYYEDEIERLTNHQPLARNSPLRNLNVAVFPDGLIRIQGRLEKSSLASNAKAPIVLPGQSPVVQSLIRETHNRIGHAGRNQVIAELQKDYWIIRVTWAVKRINHKCTVCRRYRGQTIQQQMAQLPADRVETDQPPFTKSGMDYFGPLWVKVKRHREKRYGVLFTCPSSRAVHLEIAHSLTTDAYIMAIRRFVARRGHVLKIISDNGSNLVGAETEINTSIKELNQEKLEKSLARMGIEWRFNTPTASHQGGLWERMIRTTRKCLYGILKDQVMDEEGLQTAFAEAEYLINSRPLTTVKNSPEDLEPISPNMLLTTKSNISTLLQVEGDNYATRRWKQVAHLSGVFWRRFKAEYLTVLLNRSKWLNPKRNVKCGDVVLIKDVNTYPGDWPLAVVVNTFPGTDNLVRNVEVRTAKSTYQRPVQKLVMLVEND